MDKEIPMLIKVSGPYPPGLCTIGGQTYAISGGPWVPVPEGTTLDQLEWDDTMKEIRERVRKETANKKPLKAEVKGSKGNVYQVERKNGQWSCTCDGYMYRKKCSHIEKVKKEQ